MSALAEALAAAQAELPLAVGRDSRELPLAVGRDSREDVPF